MRRLVLLLVAVSSPAVAQAGPEARSILHVRASEGSTASGYGIAADSSLNARRWRTATSFLSSAAGALVVGVAGAWVGFELARECYDVCIPPEMFVGWAAGSTVGASLGAHLGGGRSGSWPWVLAASAAAQAGLWLVAPDGLVVLIPVSVLAATIAERVTASGRAD